MSLQALRHFVFELTGFDRLDPAMIYQRSPRKVQHDLMSITREIRVKGITPVNGFMRLNGLSLSAKLHLLSADVKT